MRLFPRVLMRGLCTLTNSRIRTPLEHLKNLNEQQQIAVEHVDGPILVLAGAGSGKTRVLTRRVVNLVLQHKVDPRSILAVTFTNKATEEMRNRLRESLHGAADQPWVATFHSMGLRMLRRFAPNLGYQNSFVVYDEDDSKGIMKRLIKELNIDEKRYPPQFFLHAQDRAKNNFISPQDLAQQANGSEQALIAEVYDQYQKRLMASNAMDFGDLLFNTLRLLSEHPDVARKYQENLRYLLVDEFQDTNKVQYLILKILAHKHRNLFIVGDDDQSIYGFRGASIQNILNFEQDYPETRVIKLEQNYRSTQTILSAAHSVIEKNKQRKEKQLWCAGVPGTPIKTYLAPDESDEAYFIAKEIQGRKQAGFSYRDIAIFYRTNAQSRALEDIMVAMKIPYRIFGALRFYDRKEIKDVLAYLKLLINENDTQAFLRVINTPPRGIGAQSLQSAITLAANEGISFMAAIRSLSSRSKGFAAFLKLYDELKTSFQTERASTIVTQVIEKSGYRERLKEMKDQSAVSRLENLQELENVVRSLDGATLNSLEVLTEFLDRVSLTSGSELPVQENRDKELDAPAEYVSLMTLHLAKGLEFPVVFLTGLEEGLLPHYRSLNQPDEIEEERRLCYVGITRAMKELYITRARKRGMFSSGDGGLGMFREPSRFAFDLPKNLLSACGPDFLNGEWELTVDDQDDFSFDDDDWGANSTFGRKKKEKAKGGGGLVLTADELIRRR